MNKLIKPQKQSYTGEDAQVVAYADICEMAWVANLCVGGIGVAATVLAATLGNVPLLLASWGVSCFLAYVFLSAGCNGII